MGEEKAKKVGMTDPAEKDLEIEKRRKKRMSYFPLPRFGCMTLDDAVSVEETPGGGRSFALEAVDGEGKGRLPSHLVVVVNGIIGSAVDWKYAARLFVKAFPNNIIVHFPSVLWLLHHGDICLGYTFINDGQSNMVNGLEEASSRIRVPTPRRTHDMEGKKEWLKHITKNPHNGGGLKATAR